VNKGVAIGADIAAGVDPRTDADAHFAACFRR
jgi:hypothetical protein